MKIGTASYGSNYVKKQYAKLKDGEQAFRILPPIGDLADKGTWSVFWQLHYGYKNSAGKLRPFASPLFKNRTNQMIEVPDAALDRINGLKAEFEKAKKEGNKELIARLDKLVGQKGQYNLDKNHYMNAIDTQGNIVILQLRHRAKVALEATIERLKASGVDPLSADNGRFFVFRRSGMGLDTTFQVEVMRKKIHVKDIGEVEQEVVHKLTDDIIARLSKEAGRLDQLYKRPTGDEVKRIVLEGARAVDEILDAKASTESADDLDGADQYDDETPATAPAAVQSAPVQATPAPAAPQVTTTPAPQAAAPTPVATAPAATLPATTAESIADLSNDDFLKTMGL